MNVKTDWAKLSAEALEDRRRGTRVNLRYQLEVSGEDSNGQTYLARAYTRDVSEKGCRFEIARSMARGETPSLRVLRRTSTGAFEDTKQVLFRIAWVTQEDGICLVGAEMIGSEAPWGVAFPSKTASAKAS